MRVRSLAGWLKTRAGHCTRRTAARRACPALASLRTGQQVTVTMHTVIVPVTVDRVYLGCLEPSVICRLASGVQIEITSQDIGSGTRTITAGWQPARIRTGIFA